MNQEIYSIIEDMKRRSPKDPIQNPHILQTYQSVQMARLLVLLAEESERQNQKVEDYSKRTAYFTKVLIWFTLALIFIGFIQICMMVIKP